MQAIYTIINREIRRLVNGYKISNSIKNPINQEILHLEKTEIRISE
jgi:hypothetical protein